MESNESSRTLPRTEKLNEKSRYLDTFTSQKIVSLMLDEEEKTIGAVRECETEIIQAADCIAMCLRNGGSYIEIGAGTSGRLGVLDAVECVPTFNAYPGQVVGIIAGGTKALTQSIEGAEDDEEAAIEDLRKIDVGENDIVCGITASGTTPYTLCALRYAREQGACTVLVTCGNVAQFEDNSPIADNIIAMNVGPEVIAGSTRLKAGTATKVVLNTLSSTAFVRLGKTYDGLMIDLVIKNKKLRKRAVHMVMLLTSCNEEVAARHIHHAKGSVKVALVMFFNFISRSHAQELLKKHHDFLRPIIGNKEY